MATACRTPAIGLFGPTDPAILFDPVQDMQPIRNGRSCQGCWNGAMEMCKPGICPKQIDGCMATIHPETVIAAALKQLQPADAACA